MKVFFRGFILAILLPAMSQAELVQQTRVLFHAGERKYLEQDIRDKTIPQDVWDHVIFGKTDFDLPEFRKGLYGAEVLVGTSLYSTYKLLEGHEPWVMAIQINPRCLEKNKYYESYYTVNVKTPGENSVFEKWYWQQHKENPQVEQCLEAPSDEGIAYWPPGKLYSKGSSSDSQSEVESRKDKMCQSALDQFIRDMDIKIVGDIANDNSWYIRDRSCIESISGTPDELFKMMVTNQIGNPEDLATTNLFGNNEAGVFPTGNIYISLKVLAETTLLNQENLEFIDQFLQNLESSDNATLEKSEKLRLSFSTTSFGHVFLIEALQAAKSSIRAKQVSLYQSKLKDLLGNFVKESGEACHGNANGVSAKYKIACERVASKYGSQVMKFFTQFNKIKN
ncbi:MAG TPA: hypothetical protein VN132_03945 [Bdellovibrio sp.]|nr:hypothetical protein [Bdellovibrio sp.]